MSTSIVRHMKTVKSAKTEIELTNRIITFNQKIMPQITGITRLNAALDRLKTIAEEVRENHTIKQDWLDEKSEGYQESDAGQNIYPQLMTS